MVRTIYAYLSLAHSVIHQNIKTARSSNQKLVAFFVGMSPAGFATRNVVEIENPFHIKWQMNLILNR